MNNLGATIVSFNSQKPGIGKSFITKELAGFLSTLSPNDRILIIDSDEQNFSQGTAWGFNKKQINNCNLIKVLNDVEKNTFDKENFYKNLLKHSSKKLQQNFENIFVLPMSYQNFDERFQTKEKTFYQFIKYIYRDFDYIIIDTNSNVFVTGSIALSAFNVSQIIYQITSIDRNSIRSTIENMAQIKELDEKQENHKNIINKSRIIFNKVPDVFKDKNSEIDFLNIQEILKNIFKGKIYSVVEVNQESVNSAWRDADILCLAVEKKGKLIFKKDTEKYPELKEDIEKIAIDLIKLRDISIANIKKNKNK